MLEGLTPDQARAHNWLYDVNGLVTAARTSYLRRAVMLYCLTLPFALPKDFGYGVFFMTVAISYILFGIGLSVLPPVNFSQVSQWLWFKTALATLSTMTTAL